MPQFMPQFPTQGQQNPPAQPPWQGQPSQSLPPSPPPGQWQQPNTGFQSAPPYPGQWQQPVQPGMYPPPQQQPVQPGMYPPPQQPMQSGMYPPPQQQTPKKKSRRGLWIVLGVIVVLLLVFGGIVAAINNGAKSADTVAATQVATIIPPTAIVQTQPTTVSGNQHFKVGQVVKVNTTWLVTINSVKTMNGDTFSTPTTGNTYFIVDVTLKNLSGQEQNVSSALNFSLQDGTRQKYTETILIGETPPDGKIGAGSLMHGQLTYEVPISQNSFTFNFEPDLVAGGLTVWDLQK